MNKKNLLILTIIFSVLFLTALVFEKFQDKVALLNIFKVKTKNNPSKTEETKEVQNNIVPSAVIKSDISEDTSLKKIQKDSIVLTKSAKPIAKVVKQEETKEEVKIEEKSDEDQLVNGKSEDSSEELIINNMDQSSKETSEEELIVNNEETSNEDESTASTDSEEEFLNNEYESSTTTESLFDRQTREERENNFKQGYNKPSEATVEPVAPIKEKFEQTIYQKEKNVVMVEEPSYGFTIFTVVGSSALVIYNVHQTYNSTQEIAKLTKVMEEQKVPIKNPTNPII